MELWPCVSIDHSLSQTWAAAVVYCIEVWRKMQIGLHACNMFYAFLWQFILSLHVVFIWMKYVCSTVHRFTFWKLAGSNGLCRELCFISQVVPCSSLFHLLMLFWCWLYENTNFYGKCCQVVFLFPVLSYPHVCTFCFISCCHPHPNSTNKW